jgi:hypothetical protein
MVGFWVFLCLLLICATIVICVWLSNSNENYSSWETRNGIEKICIRLSRIEEALAKMGGK